MKKQYNVPVLKTFGSVQDLTLGLRSGDVTEFRYTDPEGLKKDSYCNPKYDEGVNYDCVS
jgi:hypothetical protein